MINVKEVTQEELANPVIAQMAKEVPECGNIRMS